MAGKPSFFVIVPAFNEAENMPRLMAAFRELQTEFGGGMDVKFIMVDDGSSDGTAQTAKNLSEGMSLAVLSHPRNIGPGAAFATAFGHVADKLADDDWVCTIEGDNTSRHELIRQMFTRSKEGYEVILASPYMYGGGITQTSTLRVILSHVANAFVKEFLGIHGIMTMSSFFRIYRGSAIKRLQKHYGPGIVERTGFESMVEMVMKMISLRLTISEVPMLLDSSRRAGKSKMKVLRTIRGYITLLKDKKNWRYMGTI